MVVGGFFLGFEGGRARVRLFLFRRRARGLREEAPAHRKQKRSVLSVRLDVQRTTTTKTY
jgi:hypothetical protein